MTKEEYVQSLKDKGVKKAEALELLNQWDIDNKPKEVEVEKTKVVAEKAAPVTAQNQSSTDSTLESVSSELSSDKLGSKDKEPDKPKEKKKVKVKLNNKEEDYEVDESINFSMSKINQDLGEGVSIGGNIIGDDVIGVARVNTEDSPELMDDVEKEVLKLPYDYTNVSERGIVSARKRDYYLPITQGEDGEPVYGEPMMLPKTFFEDTENALTSKLKDTKDPQDRLELIKDIQSIGGDIQGLSPIYGIKTGDESNLLTSFTIDTYEKVIADPNYFLNRVSEQDEEIEGLREQLSSLQNSDDKNAPILIEQLNEDILNAQQERALNVQKSAQASFILDEIDELALTNKNFCR